MFDTKDLCRNFCFDEVKKNDKRIEALNFNLKELKQKKIFFIDIDFDTIKTKDYKKIIKNIQHFKRYAIRNKMEIGKKINGNMVFGSINNLNHKNQNHLDLIAAFNVVLLNSKEEKYNYIYDYVCETLDSFFYDKNLCDFKNNKCGEKINTTSNVGCCHHFKYKFLGPFSQLVECEYLREDYTCGAKCISCKLFTCDYLRKKGVKFKLKSFLLINIFFNPIQKYFIKVMTFTPKKKIIKRLIFFS